MSEDEAAATAGKLVDLLAGWPILASALVIIAVVFIWRMHLIVKAFGEVSAMHQKNRQKHLRGMKKLKNQRKNGGD